jgi:hypothetical protein
MKLVIIFGPPAVGKMTVGMELAKITGLKLFHNHVTIELVLNFFEFGTPAFNRLVGEFRRRICEEVASSELEGMIFTFVWALEVPPDKKFIDEISQIFETKNGTVYFVELVADQAERLKRNDTELRLSQKPSKRNVEESNKRLIENDTQYQMNSIEEFFYTENYLKIDNTSLKPVEVASRIADHFDFTSGG